MPYVAARRMTASGIVYEAGDVVPLDAIPPRARASLLGTRRLHEVDEATAQRKLAEAASRPKAAVSPTRVRALAGAGRG